MNVEFKATKVKCSSNKKDCTIKEACNGPSFYLRKVENQIKLKTSHAYYYQCRGVMASLRALDVIVYTMNDIHIERIMCDEYKWNSKILPELTQKWEF